MHAITERSAAHFDDLDDSIDLFEVSDDHDDIEHHETADNECHILRQPVISQFTRYDDTFMRKPRTPPQAPSSFPFKQYNLSVWL
jgi:hypothetical protein